MKFEKISDDKFQLFSTSALKNLNAIVGGKIETERPGTGTHDTAHTDAGGGGDVRKTKDANSDDSTGDLV